jgi:DNA processing protein
MNYSLDDESYARAALTYLAEPANHILGRLLRLHGATRTLEAIQAGSDDADGFVLGGPTAGNPDEDRYARSSVRRAVERWRVRLPEVPSPDDVIAFRRAGIRLVCPGDPEWPSQLADLGDAQPYALWLRGSVDLRFSCLQSVAIVGSRAATAYGCYVAADFAASVAARGWAVVSGGAFGIDSSAHRGALGAADGVTVAVLACGVDVPYPTAHAELLDAIAAQGVVVSEWPPGRQVSRLRFLVRNRVIAALASGTLVVEAAERSGAVNTARNARDLNRVLMAVPGPITSVMSVGCHRIIREWQATLVTSSDEVIEHLSPLGTPRAMDPPDTRPALPVVGRDALDLESATVLDAMPRRGGMGTTRIAQRAGLPPATIVRCLGELTAAGFTERCPEGWRLRRT